MKQVSINTANAPRMRCLGITYCLFFVLLTLIVSCGQKGPLKLPTPEETPPSSSAAH